MKTFIISYIISLGILVAAWLPDVMARPFHILPRLAFYMAFPMAIFLGMAIIILASYFGIKTIDIATAEMGSHRSAGSHPVKKSA